MIRVTLSESPAGFQRRIFTKSEMLLSGPASTRRCSPIRVRLCGLLVPRRVDIHAGWFLDHVPHGSSNSPKRLRLGGLEHYGGARDRLRAKKVGDKRCSL